MRVLLGIAVVALGLVGCGEAVPIDPDAIVAENVRREEVRVSDAAAASRERDASAQAAITAAAAPAATVGAVPEEGTVPAAAATETPPVAN